MTATDQVLARSLLWMTVGAAAGIPVLILPQPDDPLWTATIQLSLVFVYATGLVFHLAPHAEQPGFDGIGLGLRPRLALTWAVAVVAVAGVAGVAALATSAALRYDPSLQFLQLLAGLGIGGSTAAVVLGARRRIGSRAAFGGAVVVGVLGIGSIWRYLDAVGFTPSGGWIVDGSELVRLVAPYDAAIVAAAAMAFSAGVNAEQGQGR